jgi:hypothetical protein
VFGLGVLRRDRQAIAASLIAFFFFGGMLVTVFPTEIGVSWEYHLAGALSGLLGAVLFRRPTRRRRASATAGKTSRSPRKTPTQRCWSFPSPDDVPVIWQRPLRVRGVVVPFRRREAAATTIP